MSSGSSSSSCENKGFVFICIFDPLKEDSRKKTKKYLFAFVVGGFLGEANGLEVIARFSNVLYLSESEK